MPGTIVNGLVTKADEEANTRRARGPGVVRPHGELFSS